MMKAPMYLILDVDNTLYPKSCGLDEALRQRILSFMVERFGITYEEAAVAREKYVKKFGMSLPGIVDEFNADIADFQVYVHDLDIPSFVKPNPGLAAMLAEIPAKMVLFTNSTTAHSIRILEALGVDSSLFSHIIDYNGIGHRAKPSEEAFKAMLDILGTTGVDCLFVDDMPRSICIAKRQFGMLCALVDEDNSGGCNEADWSIKNIDELAGILRPIYGLNACRTSD
jgi:putative hydrolase of the HAD superfamily